jgi:hypothetical protein
LIFESGCCKLHKIKPFKEEYLEILEKNNIEFKEEYLFEFFIDIYDWD